MINKGKINLLKILMVMSFFVCALLMLTACNSVPSDLQGTYRNGSAGSEWKVTETTVYTDTQALLYDFNGYNSVVIGPTNKSTFTINTNVKVAGDLIGDRVGVSNVNQLIPDNLVATMAIADNKYLTNYSLNGLSAYQFQYGGIVYMYASYCEHILVK